MRGLAPLLAGACLLALAGCSPAAEAPQPETGPLADTAQTPYGPGPDAVEGEPLDAAFSGEVTWTGPAPPETARLIIEVRDVTRTADTDDLVLREEFPIASGAPAAFSGRVSKFDLIPGGNLVLRARVQDGYAILYASDGDIDIADSGDTAGLQVALLNPEDLVRGRPSRMITPAGTSYICGGEPVTIAVEAGAAYVTFGDGTSVKLDKLDTSADGAAQFTNGRFLVEQSGPSIRFGRGRAAPQSCTAG